MNDGLKLALQYAGKGADRKLEKLVFSKVRKATESLEALVDCDVMHKAAEASMALTDYNDAMSGILKGKRRMEEAMRTMSAAEISRAAEILRDKTPLDQWLVFTNPVASMVDDARNFLNNVAVAQRSEGVLRTYLNCKLK